VSDITGDDGDPQLVAQRREGALEEQRLPEPGEETRLNVGTPRRSGARTRPAISSLRAMTRSRTSIVLTVIVGHLQIAEVQGVAELPQDSRLGTAERRLSEQRLETERKILRLDTGVIADRDAKRHEGIGRLTQPLLGQAADLECDAHLMH
jgi:hypothetical protein